MNRQPFEATTPLDALLKTARSYSQQVGYCWCWGGPTVGRPHESGCAALRALAAELQGATTIETLAVLERRAIFRALEAAKSAPRGGSGDRLAVAARMLGISRTTLWRRRQAYKRADARSRS